MQCAFTNPALATPKTRNRSTVVRVLFCVSSPMIRPYIFACALLPFISLQVYAQSWQRLLQKKECSADSSVYGLAIDSTGRVLLAGEDGLAYFSADNSVSFTPLRIGTAIDLYDTGFPSRFTLAVCGDSGVYLLSPDNGATWVRTKLDGFETRAHYAMCWIDSSTALLGGGSRAVAHGSLAVPDGYILRSLDGGKTWTSTFVDPGSFVWALAAERQGPNRRCFAAAYSPLSGGRILVSTDNGAGWTVAVNNLPFLPHDIAAGFGAGGIITVGGNPFALAGNPRIAWMDELGVWSILPDTLPSVGFAWSVAASSQQAARASNIFVGTQSGAILISDSLGGGWHVDDGGSEIHCPVYALATRQLDNPGASSLTLAAGSGRGLFRRQSDPSGNDTPALAASPRLAVEVFPQPVVARNGSRVVIGVRDIIAAPLRITLLDLLGRHVTSIECGMPSGTFQSIRMELQDVSAGCYVIHAQNGMRTGHARITIL